MENNQKYCKHCGELIDKDCVICPKCGKQVEELKNRNDNPIIINNSASASAAASVVSAGKVRKLPLVPKVVLDFCSWHVYWWNLLDNRFHSASELEIQELNIYTIL